MQLFYFNGTGILSSFHNFPHPKTLVGEPLGEGVQGVDLMEVGGAVDLILRVAFLLVRRVAVVEEVALLVELEGGYILDLQLSLHLSEVNYRQHWTNISMRKIAKRCFFKNKSITLSHVTPIQVKLFRNKIPFKHFVPKNRYYSILNILDILYSKYLLGFQFVKT